jgi:hypothetical protein
VLSLATQSLLLPKPSPSRARSLLQRITMMSLRSSRPSRCDIVHSDNPNRKTLLTTLQDSNAIFGITNIFEYLLEKSPEDAAARERQQLVNIATAADKISSLEHLILHTLPAGKKISDTFVPHFDVSQLPSIIAK